MADLKNNKQPAPGGKKPRRPGMPQMPNLMPGGDSFWVNLATSVLLLLLLAGAYSYFVGSSTDKPVDIALSQVAQDINKGLVTSVEVNGDDADPLYAYLRAEGPGDSSPTGEKAQGLVEYLRTNKPDSLEGDNVKWNFTKFLVGRDGSVIRRYESWVTPEEMKPDLEALLG